MLLGHTVDSRETLAEQGVAEAPPKEYVDDMLFTDGEEGEHGM